MLERKNKMAKINMIHQAQQKIKQEQKQQQTITEQLNQLFGDRTPLIVESIVDLLGKIYAQMKAGKPIGGKQLTPQQQQTLARMLAGAKILGQDPDVGEAFNLTSDRLRDLMVRVGSKDPKANAALARIGDASANIQREMAELIKTYNEAVSMGNKASADLAAAKIQKLWLLWQRQMQKMQNIGHAASNTATQAANAQALQSGLAQQTSSGVLGNRPR